MSNFPVRGEAVADAWFNSEQGQLAMQQAALYRADVAAEEAARVQHLNTAEADATVLRAMRLREIATQIGAPAVETF